MSVFEVGQKVRVVSGSWAYTYIGSEGIIQNTGETLAYIVFHKITNPTAQWAIGENYPIPFENLKLIHERIVIFAPEGASHT